MLLICRAHSGTSEVRSHWYYFVRNGRINPSPTEVVKKRCMVLSINYGSYRLKFFRHGGNICIYFPSFSPFLCMRNIAQQSYTRLYKVCRMNVFQFFAYFSILYCEKSCFFRTIFPVVCTLGVLYFSV